VAISTLGRGIGMPPEAILLAVVVVLGCYMHGALRGLIPCVPYAISDREEHSIWNR
jgi:hypothetical protein